MAKELTQEQSLEMIQSMISISRQNFRNGGFYYILWGSLFFLASIAQYVLFSVFNSEQHWFSWLVAGLLAAVINFVIKVKERSKPRVKTYIDRMNFYLWTAFVFSILFVAFLTSQGNLAHSQINPLIIMFYGFATFISGGMLRFNWLIAGAIAAWILAIISSFQAYETQMIFVSVTILVSYLIPGIMLNISKDNNA